MLQGTSMASPQAAGAAALLVSAAKQAGVQSQPAQLRQALTSTARFLPRYGAYEQGNGLINVGAASTVALGLNTAKTLSVVVHPTSAGVHSAILNLDDPAPPGVDYQTLN